MVIQQQKITMETNDNSKYEYNYCNHGNYCHDNSKEELVYTVPIITGVGPTVTMEVSLMNQSEDDHSGGQEETRESRLCYVM